VRGDVLRMRPPPGRKLLGCSASAGGGAAAAAGSAARAPVTETKGAADAEKENFLEAGCSTSPAAAISGLPILSIGDSCWNERP